MVGLPKIEVLAAGLRQARCEFGPDESAEKCEHASENPDAENEKRRVDVERDDIRVNENAGADDPAHDDHGGVERVQAARWSWRGQGREDISEGDSRPLKVESSLYSNRRQ